MTEEQIIEIIKLEAHKNLTIVDEGTDSYNDYVIRGVDLMAKSLVNLFAIPTVTHRFIPQPIEIEKLMKEKWEHRMINDDLGWTGEWRMSAKDILDLIIDLQNGA